MRAWVLLVSVGIMRVCAGKEYALYQGGFWKNVIYFGGCDAELPLKRRKVRDEKF